MRRSSSCSGCAICWPRAGPGRTRWSRSGARRCSRRTRRCRRATTRSRSTGRTAPVEQLGIDERSRRAVPRARAPTTTGTAPQFNMTALAMRSSGAINAVSQLHGSVTREMFAPLWPDVDAADRPGQRDHERRARADLDGGRPGGAVRAASEPGVARAVRGPGVLGAHPGDSGRGDLGAARPAARRICSSSSANARASDGRPIRPAPRASWHRAPCSIRRR